MRTWRLQTARFIVIGLLSNTTLYLLYLVLTSHGIGHKTAMTLLYAVGILQTFVFNRKWTFAHRGRKRTSFLRYGIVYATGYLLNLSLMLLLVDQQGYPHAVVQGAAILVVAAYLFLLQKFWVFPDKTGAGLQVTQNA